MKRMVITIISLVAIIILSNLPVRNVTQVNLSRTLEPPSVEYLFGTDNLGRDVFALMVKGLSRTLTVVVSATLISFVFGVFLGVISGYFGNTIENIIQLFTDITLIIPSFISAMIITAIVGFNPLSAGIILGLTSIGEYSNQTTVLCKSVKNMDYIENAVICGLPSHFIIVRHILPNIINPLLTFMANRASGVTISYAALTFIGVGSDITNPDWGTMLYQYRAYIFHYPLLLIWPSIGIFLLSCFFHFTFDDIEHKGEHSYE